MMKNPDCYQVMENKELVIWHKNMTCFDVSPFPNEDYVYHTLAAKASGELCLKYIFAFGAFARMPLLQRFVNCTFFNLRIKIVLYLFFVETMCLLIFLSSILLKTNYYYYYFFIILF